MFCKIESPSSWTHRPPCPHGRWQGAWVREEAGGSQMPLLLMVNLERAISFFLKFVSYELLQVPVFSGDFLTFSCTCWITLPKWNHDKEPQGAAPSKWTSELLLLIGLGNSWSTEVGLLTGINTSLVSISRLHWKLISRKWLPNGKWRLGNVNNKNRSS